MQNERAGAFKTAKGVHLNKQNLKAGSLVRAGYKSYRDDAFNYIIVWTENRAGAMASGTIEAGTHGVVIDNDNNMVRVQWPKCLGWVYSESVTAMQE